MPKQRLRQGIFLVGGKGTRLGSITATTPKPMVPISGRPFLEIAIDHLARFGLEEIILLCGHFGAQIAEHFDGTERRGARIRCVIEPEPAGTGGALRHAAEILDERFILCNGDSLFDINVLALMDEFDGMSAAGVLALRRIDNAGRYGAITLKDGRITSFAPRGGEGPGLINGGVYILRKEILDWIHTLPCSIEADVFPRLAAAGRLAGREMDGFFLDIGVPEALSEAQSAIPGMLTRPALFLDRDGVVNHDIGYLHRPKDFRWLPGVPEAIRLANDAGYWVFVVTNQAGVARGYYPEGAVHALHRWINGELQSHGAHVDAFYHCPHHPEGSVAAYARVCDCRKPAPGLLQAAFTDWPVNPQASFMIGDKPTDTAAARAAGIPGFLFEEGDGRLDDLVKRLLDAPGFEPTDPKTR